MLNSFQPAISDLSHTMSELSGVSGELALITRETRDGMGEQQRESKDLLVAVEELSDAAGRVNESAVNAETAAVSAKENAEGGSEVVVQVTGTIQELAAEVENAVTVVRQLAEDTQGIGHVAKSINEIAEQTNLLALNAAIEAARAGEQGRGFAVVADEVRSLAIRTQDSTKEINDIIERLVSVSEKAVQVMDASKDRAQQGVQDTERAREALQQIATGVENIRSMNSRISAAADNQNNVVSRINENIRVISQASEQTLSASGRTFEHSNDLGQIVQRLREIVERFRV
jgi:methyl-accepting chemotaxis protein